MNTPTRPVLRYHGGKFRIADWIVSFFPDHAAYLEPFGGAASVLLRKPRVGTEIYNDLDCEVVNLFRLLRDYESAAELAHRLRFTGFAREEFDASYLPPIDKIDQAHKLIVRSFMGHGSDAATRRSQPGFRTKRSRSKSQGGQMSASPAREFSTFPDAVLDFHERLCGVVIENRPASDLITQFDSPSTLIYADPPYCLSSRSLMRGSAKSSHGYRHEMTDDDHRALAERLHKCESMVVLSGYATALYDQELYPDWHRFERTAVVESGTTRTEVVWLNPACTAALVGQQAQQRLIV